MLFSWDDHQLVVVCVPIDPELNDHLPFCINSHGEGSACAVTKGVDGSVQKHGNFHGEVCFLGQLDSTRQLDARKILFGKGLHERIIDLLNERMRALGQTDKFNDMSGERIFQLAEIRAQRYSNALEKKRLRAKHGNGEKEEQKSQKTTHLFGLQSPIGMGGQGTQWQKSDQRPIRPFCPTKQLEEEQKRKGQELYLKGLSLPCIRQVPGRPHLT